MGKEIRIESNSYLILGWNDIKALIDTVANQVEDKVFKPSLIIGIFRGGMIVAHLLSDRLGVSNIRGIGAKMYQRIGEIGKELEIYQPLPLKTLGDQDVLVTEDVVDTGTTLKGILEREIYPKYPRSLCTASLFVKTGAKERPDFHCGETTCWICYPWEVWEVGREMYQKLLQKYDSETAEKILIEQFEIEPQIVGRIVEA